MFIVLIGLSHSFHLHTLLEKRVMSRLNAQFVYITPAGTIDVCRHMAKLLQVDVEELYDYENESDLDCSSGDNQINSTNEEDIVDDTNSMVGRKRGRSNSTYSTTSNSSATRGPIILSDYVERYNMAISQVFGSIANPTKSMYAMSSSAVGKDKRCFIVLIILILERRQSFLSLFVVLSGRKTWRKGSVHGLIECAVNWGRDMR